jgi:hypothetical protein
MMLLKASALCGSNPSALLAATMACAKGCSERISVPVQASSSWRLVQTIGVGGEPWLLSSLCGSIPYAAYCNWVEITSAQGQAITNSVMAVSTIDQSPDAKQNRYGKY